MTKNELLLEQYKIAIDGANKISERRGSMNNLFISINGAILVFIGTFKDVHEVILISTIFGFLLAMIWALKIKSYKEINKSKFNIIYKIEANFPIKLYKEEWDDFKKNNSWSITEHEVWIPVIFGIVYTFIGIFLGC